MNRKIQYYNRKSCYSYFCFNFRSLPFVRKGTTHENQHGDELLETNDKENDL